MGYLILSLSVILFGIVSEARAQEWYQLSISKGSTYSLSDFTPPSVTTHEYNDFICNQTTVPGNSGSVNPKYIIIEDPANEGRYCYKDVSELITPLPLGNYSLTLKSFTILEDYRSDGIRWRDYSLFSASIPFIRQNCDPSSGCDACNYNTVGYITELHPNTPPGNFNIKITEGVEVNIPTSSEQVSMPGFNRPVQIGDIWKSSYCIP